MTTPAPDPVAVLASLARTLRERGAAADTGSVAAAVEALAHLDASDPADVYWAGRLALCADPDDIAAYDAVFADWLRGGPELPADRGPDPVARFAPAGVWSSPRPADDGDGNDGADIDAVGVAASAAEVLRHRDVADLTAAERAEVDRLIGLLRPAVALRRTRRRRPGGRRDVDIRRTVRAMLRNGGEPAAIARMRRGEKPRRLLLLIDVSGSMSPYADLLLRFAHAAVRVAPMSTEVFTVGTRLTRLTRHLRGRDPEEALRTAGRAIPDWSGGTRLGESLRVFLDRWGRRGTARQAVAVIASDGWERGDVALLGEQMARLARLAHRVVWVNPHRGRAGFTPTAAGMAAALPHLDDLVAGHTVASLQQLARVIRHA